MGTYLPGAVQKPISRNFGGFRRSTRGAVVHVDAGGATSLYGWFNNPASQASSHLYIKYDGTIEQYVDLDRIVWTQRAGNATMIGIETQGKGVGSWTDAQIKSLVYALAWIARHYGFPLVDMQSSYPSARGVGMHRYGISPWRVAGGQVWGPNGKICPGHDRARQFKAGLLFVGGGSAPTPSPGGGTSEPSAAAKFNAGFTMDHIRWVQTELKKRGLYKDTVDGIRGPNTQAAIKAFQAANGLAADGMPGPLTTAKLKGAAPVSKPAPAPAPKPAGLTVDGHWGPATTRRLQQYFGTTQDGVISGQVKGNWNAAIASAQWGRGGSELVRAMQRWLGVSADGYMGPGTIKALQRRLGTTADGYISAPSELVKEMQRRLNAGRL